MIERQRLSDLISRVEGAREPSRALDVFIAQAVDKPTNMLNGMWFDEAVERFPNDLAGIALHWPIAPFTSSLDAALALVDRVLPGWKWDVGCSQGSGFIADIWRHKPVEDFRGCAKTPALALILALLIALQEGIGN